MIEDKFLASISKGTYDNTFPPGINISKIKYYNGDFLKKYYIFLPGNRVVFAFRGSESRMDWWNNIMSVHTTDFGQVNVGQGFLTQLSAESNPYFEFNSETEIVLTGHSLGGALAQLEAKRLIDYGYANNIKRLVTFGSPKVGAKSFQEHLDKYLLDKTTHYIFGDDLTPSLPPKFYRTSESNVIELGSKRSWLNPNKYIHLFKDHSMDSYMEALNAI